MSLFTAERNSKVTLIISFIPSKFWILHRAVSRVILCTGLNVYTDSSGGFRFVINSPLVYYKWSQTRSISCNSLISLLLSIKVFLKLFQNKMHCWQIEIKKALNTNFMIILKICEKQPFDVIAVDTKRSPFFMLCSHCPISHSSGCLHITIYLVVMLQVSWYTGEGN